MKPIFSEQDRLMTVTTFIQARYQGKVKISSWVGMQNYLNGHRVKLLLEMKPSEAIAWEKVYSPTRRVYIDNKNKPAKFKFSEYQAKKYFLWLIDVVGGAFKVSDDVVAEEAVIKDAVDQLFMFINALRDSTVIDEQVELIAPHNWEERIANIQETEDKRNEQIIDVLDKIRKWQEEYQPYLDNLKKEQNRFGKALKGKR